MCNSHMYGDWIPVFSVYTNPFHSCVCFITYNKALYLSSTEVFIISQSNNTKSQQLVMVYLLYHANNSLNQWRRPDQPQRKEGQKERKKEKEKKKKEKEVETSRPEWHWGSKTKTKTKPSLNMSMFIAVVKNESLSWQNEVTLSRWLWHQVQEQIGCFCLHFMGSRTRPYLSHQIGSPWTLRTHTHSLKDYKTPDS